MENRLDIHKATLNWLSDFARQGVFTTDNELVILSWNQWLEEYTGKKSTDVIGQRLDNVYPEILNRFRSYYDSALQGQLSMLSHTFHRYILPLPIGEEFVDFLPDDVEYMPQRAQLSPLKVDDNIVGTIMVIEDMTESVAKEVELQQQIVTLEAVNEIGQAILTRGMDECLHQVLETLIQLTGAPVAGVMLRHNRALTIEAVSGCESPDTHWMVDGADNIGARVVIEDDLVYIPDRRQDPLLTLHPESRSILGIPLHEQDEVNGALLIEGFSPDQFEENILHQVEMLSVQAAIAIQNIRLYDQERHTAGRMKALLEIDHAILAEESPKAIATVALKRLQQLLPYLHATIWIFEPDIGYKARVLAAHGGKGRWRVGQSVTLDYFGGWDKVKSHWNSFAASISELKTIWPQMLQIVPRTASSLLYVPLIARRKGEETMIGTLMLWDRDPDAFGSLQIDIASYMTTSLAVVVQQAYMQERLHKMSITDQLTGAYNRRYFFDMAKNQMELFQRYDKSVSVILFDLDFFKKVNDDYGHLAGDEVLKEVVKRCMGQIRDVDKMARYGGEEFVILLPETDVGNAARLAERLGACIREKPIVSLKGESISVTISLGIAEMNNSEASIEDLLDEADIALYRAKEAGRNCYRVH